MQEPLDKKDLTLCGPRPSIDLPTKNEKLVKVATKKKNISSNDLQTREGNMSGKSPFVSQNIGMPLLIPSIDSNIIQND
jgi:hypothetical protein